MRYGSFVVIAGLCVQGLAAQTVVIPEPPLDSARAELRDALLVLRDSLGSIDAAAGRLQRDYREASAASLLSRARVMRDACARSRRTVPYAREAVIRTEDSNDLRRSRRRDLVRALDQLRSELARCETEFGAMSGPGKGEEVRGYGNPRARGVQSAVRKYGRVAGDYLAVMGIRVRPLGADPRPAAS